MADRSTKVTLSAQVQQYLDGMEKARKKTSEVGSEAEKLAQKKEAFELLGKTMAASGAVMAAGIAVAVNKFAEFDQAMSYVAATGDDARQSMDALRDAAIDAGARTVFSATESANAIEEMAKAGVDAKDILAGGLDGALDLAAAGGLGVADAAGIAAVALKTFKLEGRDMAHVADLLAAGAGKAMGEVSDFSQALSQGGQAAALTGLSIEETTAALGAFASQGLLGSDAGTSLKTMLLSLNPTTKKAADLVDYYNLKAFDQQGNFIGLAEYAGKLEKALGGMSAEQQSATLKTIFGTDAYRAAAVVLDEGEQGIRDWITAVDDQGYAAETAATRLDNLRGDWEALTGAVDSALITMGSAADGPLRSFVQGLTGLVDGFNELPDGAQQTAFWIGAAGAAAATAGGLYFLAVPKIAAYNAAVATLGTTAQKASAFLGGLAKLGAIGISFTVAIQGVDALSNAIAEKLLPSADEIDDKMRKAKSGLDLFSTALNKEGITDTRQAAMLMANLGDELDRVADSNFWNPASTSGTAVTVAKELAEIAQSGDMDLFSSQFVQLGRDAELTERQMRTFIRANPELESALRAQASASGEATDIYGLLRIALEGIPAPASEVVTAAEEIQAAAEEATGDLKDLQDALYGIADSAMAAGAAQDAAIGAINSMTKAADEEKASLKGTNDESLRLRESIRGVEDAHRKSADAILENGGTLKEARREWQDGRNAVLDQLEALGLSREEAKKWADDNLGAASEVKDALNDVKAAMDNVPEKKDIEIAVNAAEAEARLKAFIDSYNNRKIKIGVSAETIVGNPSMGYPGGGRAGGGAIHGPGTSTSDSITIRASNEEHMLTAADVRAMGGQPAVYAFRESLHNGGSASVGKSTKHTWNVQTTDPYEVAAYVRREEAWEGRLG